VTVYQCNGCNHVWDAGDEPPREPQCDYRNLPPQFWEQTPVLEHIRAAAHSRTRSADAVLLFVLARVAALIPPTVRLPAIVGGRASLNFLGGIVSASGGGKTTAGDVASELVPINRKDVVADVPPGSGEGLTELYFEMVAEQDADGKMRKVKRQTKNGALIYLDEGQALAEMGNRKGATLLPTLRSAWSGAVIGQSNATQETYRVLKAHSYRMAIMVGFQLEYAAGLIADAPGGTPQRFVFATATDPTVPDEPPAWPGELVITVPPMIHTGTEIDFDPHIAAAIRARALATTRGEHTPDQLDTHRDLVRMKVAALLALLHDRLHVTILDWEMAGQVLRSSTSVRTWVIEHARTNERLSEASYALKLADRAAVAENSAERRALDGGARAIARKVHKIGGDVAKRQIASAPAGKHKKLASVDSMIERAIELKWIREVMMLPNSEHDDGRRWLPGEARPT
jgi:hypothetical protein